MSSCKYNPIPPRVWSRVQHPCTDNTAWSPFIYVPLTGQTVPAAEAIWQDKQLWKGNVLQHKANSAQLTKSQKYAQLARCAGPNRTKVFATQTQTYSNPNMSGMVRVGYQTYSFPNQVVGAPNNISGPFQYNVPSPDGCPTVEVQDGGNLMCGTFANPCTGEVYIPPQTNAAICNPASASNVPGSSILCWNKKVQSWFPKQRYVMNNSTDKWPTNYKGFVSAFDTNNIALPPPKIALQSVFNNVIHLSWSHKFLFPMDSFDVFVNGVFIQKLANDHTYRAGLSIASIKSILNSSKPRSFVMTSSSLAAGETFDIVFTALFKDKQSTFSNTLTLTFPTTDGGGGGGGGGGGDDETVNSSSEDEEEVINAKLDQILYLIASSSNAIEQDIANCCNAMGSNFGTLNTNLGNINTTLGSINGNIGSVNTTLGTINGTLGTMSTSLNTLIGDLTSIFNKLISLTKCACGCDASCNCDFYNALFASDTITQINTYVSTYISTAFEPTDTYIPVDQFDLLNIGLVDLEALFVDDPECCFKNIIDVFRNMLKLVKYAFDEKNTKQAALATADQFRQDSIILHDPAKLQQYLDMLSKSFAPISLTLSSKKATVKIQYQTYHDRYGVPDNLAYDPVLLKEIMMELGLIPN